METKYFLRHGDFRPEALTDSAYKWLGYPSKEIADKLLSMAGNMFASLEDAKEASFVVRRMLRTLRECQQRRKLGNLQNQDL